ncbi:helix-turn-helix domain-containing protein [Pararobbsia silviterrae]|nr:helix-turn-helix domain-containing protein [Pararobbsia silviterrae]
MPEVIASVRASHPGAGLIAYAPFEGSEQRVRTLLLGADHCVEPETSAAEIAALLHALARRGADILASAAAHERAADKPRKPTLWRLVNKGWTLVAPSGRALALTAGERELMERFSVAPDRRIRRMEEAGDAGEAGEHDAIGTAPESAAKVSPRVIDVMISRLRRKAAQKQVGLPIRAVPGWGYVFAGDIEAVAEPDAPAPASTERVTDVSSEAETVA